MCKLRHRSFALECHTSSGMPFSQPVILIDVMYRRINMLLTKYVSWSKPHWWQALANLIAPCFPCTVMQIPREKKYVFF
ncbi:hypothetical protein KFK09_021357 [Dendrobium nobile]|uniref:Uncharacterized protein n=1 Tax=Dendrobium nobile TaxID=94219 RepID=A0A8T3ANH0_DENNO|nr:hypothetical protein KFK09_021357 [Dendrobium nobile]